MQTRDVVVIGGGAAGMFAAATAARNGADVLLMERNNRLGTKLRITGKGRCNITNDSTVTEVLDNIPTGRQFLQSALNAFTPADCIELFESLGVPLKTERGNRVFPKSDLAADVAEALARYAAESGVERMQARATSIVSEDGKVCAVMASGTIIPCNNIILATGGLSYPATGSSGDGYRFAKSLGHSVTALRGSLVPIVAEPEICGQMQGLALKNVRLSICTEKGDVVFTEMGELLFTHFGLSGPLALSASSHMRSIDSTNYFAYIDFKPGLDGKMLDERILRDFGKYSNRDFINALGDLLTKLSIPQIVAKSGIPPHMKVHSINRAQRAQLIEQIKSFKLEVSGLRPVEEAIVTSGGVDLREINPKTMESKLVGGLFFAGEIIDADGYTGGYNLQIAWSIGFVAGRSVSGNK